jgi:hypothetical protein
MNAKTTADVRGGLPRVPARGILAAVPLGVFAEGAHVPGARDEAYTREDASRARASSGVFARTEQHVGQFFEGASSRNVRTPEHSGAAAPSAAADMRTEENSLTHTVTNGFRRKREALC